MYQDVATNKAKASHDPPPPPPPVDDFQYHHHHHDPPVHLPPHEHPPHHEYPPSNEPPPTYDEAISNGAAPPGYGTFRPFRPYTDESSIASSEVESTDRALPEWFGQLLVVFIFLCLIYGFYEFITSPDDSTPNYEWPGNGRWHPPTNLSRLYRT
jgi:hypothetical protein